MLSCYFLELSVDVGLYNRTETDALLFCFSTVKREFLRTYSISNVIAMNANGSQILYNFTSIFVILIMNLIFIRIGWTFILIAFIPLFLYRVLYDDPSTT